MSATPQDSDLRIIPEYGPDGRSNDGHPQPAPDDTPGLSAADGDRTPVPSELERALLDIERNPHEAAVMARRDPDFGLEILGRFARVFGGAPDLLSVRRAHGRSRTFREALRDHGATLALINGMTALLLLGEREMGARLEALARHQGAHHDEPSPYQATLRECRIEARTAGRWREMAKIPDEDFEAYVEPAIRAVALGEETPPLLLSRNDLLRRARDRGGGGDHHSDDAQLVELVSQLLGDDWTAPAPDSDPAAWAGKLWLNPDSERAGAWAKGATDALAEGRVEAALLRVPFHPGAYWWAAVESYPMCAIRPMRAPFRVHNRLARTVGCVFALKINAHRFFETFDGVVGSVWMRPQPRTERRRQDA